MFELSEEKNYWCLVAVSATVYLSHREFSSDLIVHQSSDCIEDGLFDFDDGFEPPDHGLDTNWVHEDTPDGVYRLVLKPTFYDDNGFRRVDNITIENATLIYSFPSYDG